MKKYTLSIFILFIHFISTAQHNKKYDVYWSLGSMRNESLNNLSFKILQAISQDKIQALDADGKIMMKNQVKERIPEDLVNPDFTEAEIKIMLKCGDFSVLDYLETNYTEADLDKMLIEKKDYMQFFKSPKLKKLDKFETKNLKVEIHEVLILDTTIRSQKGSIKYLRLLIPHYYTSSKKDEFLCQVKYEDLKKLKFKPEQKTLDQRKFIITTMDGNISVINETETHKLSETITIGENPDRNLLDQSIFRYFKNSIKLFDPVFPGGGFSDY